MNAQIAAEALEWIGTPFHWQGRVKGVGCDCKGLAAGVAAICGRPEALSLEALAGDYGEGVFEPRRLKAGLRRLFDPVPRDAIAAGDIVLIKFHGKPQHIGIALDGREMVHCHAGAGKVVRGLIGRGRLDSVWRWR